MHKDLLVREEASKLGLGFIYEAKLISFT